MFNGGEIMKLYEVTNGFMGDSYLRVLVVAPNKRRAKELASLKFKEEARNKNYEKELEMYKKWGWDTSGIKEYRYPERFWKDLEVVCLCDDLTNEWSSEVIE
ncbi:hypothetical protein [Parageobacillus toebii]|uniref:hypothetical protein n=1 Tax=Parageobacillus toebii TaxID=153151 RepID=UPI002E250720|nr:hypothetical protein [Parageobacillus toebii]